MSLELSRFSSLATLLLAFTLTACGGGGDDGGDDDGSSSSPECIEAEEQQISDLGWIEDNIFARSCTLSEGSCHRAPANQAQDLVLDRGDAEESLVGVPAKGEFAGGMELVAPGDPQNSYLLVALGQFGTDDPRLPENSNGEKITMPDASPLLCQEKRDAIERWITEL